MKDELSKEHYCWKFTNEKQCLSPLSIDNPYTDYSFPFLQETHDLLPLPSPFDLILFHISGATMADFVKM